jgi:SAM-dependent methyltransferase
MIAAAKVAVSAQNPDVREKIDFISGRAEDAHSLVGADFDLACCHSVIMYEEDPVPILRSLASSVRPGGLISIVSLNKEGIAMRSGLQGRWREAVASIQTASQAGDRYTECRAHDREYVMAVLNTQSVSIIEWAGIGIFSDHLDSEPPDDELSDIYELEWLAGTKDPYRRIARCFHIIGRLEA